MLVYIVEDDESILRMEEYALKSSGFETAGFSNSDEFFTACDKQLPTLAVLDIMLPGMDGMDILSHMKASQRLKGIPVIMVTARTSEIDAVSGLDMGADDYIHKPFGIMEFISRVKAVLRRAGVKDEKNESGDVFSVGELVLDDKTRTVTVNSQYCELTFKEYELLKYLFINRGIVLSREKLMENVWGTDYKGETRTIDVHVQSLRKKLGNGGIYIETVRNVGYRLKNKA
ncbi:MAG: response regulator transcription factor [Clostridia bacterium]|nr:response regulator transcription factor [Clostridia bacterium]